jgi:signal transduction histidine kinase/CheY-like chemotaxis protein
MATVLVVDDRSVNRELVRTILGYAGHRVLEAETGAQALELLLVDRPDLMISDVLMPGMDGYELAREVRARPATNTLPIVFYTANYLEQEARPMAAACGVEHIVAKDGDPQTLIDAVTQALRAGPQQREVLDEEDFGREHLRVLNTKLLDKVRELEEKERLAGLIDAAIVLSGDLGLTTTATRTVATARALVSARSSSLELRDQAGQLIAAASDGDRADGTVPPSPESLISVPISSSHGHRGDLRLTGPTGSGFSDADRLLITTFALAAGAALGNAHRYDDARRRQAWLAASTEVTTILLGSEPSEALDVVVRSARLVAGADIAWIEVVDNRAKSVSGQLDAGVASAVGRRLCHDVQVSGRAILIEDASDGIDPSTGPVADLAGIGALLAVPLQAGPGFLGVLILGNWRGRPTFHTLDIEMASAFAGHAAVALEFARAQADRERLRVVADRERIARDLHDVVIQRLFAVGLRLEALGPKLKAPQARQIVETIDELNLTIDDIRESIFALSSSDQRPALRRRIELVLERAERTLGFRPQARVDPRIDALEPSAVHLHLLATVNEALSNVARHAGATTAHVSVWVVGDELVATVTDDGRGLATNRHESGLANLRRRAELVGGAMTTEPGPGGIGLVLTWRAPL